MRICIKRKSFLAFVLAILCALIAVFNAAADYKCDITLTGIVVLLISVYMIYRYRNNVGLSISMLFIFLSNYSIIVGVYFDPSVRPSSMYGQITDVTVYNKALTAILLFELGLMVYSLINMEEQQDSFLLTDKVNSSEEKEIKNTITSVDKLISIVCLIAFAVIFFSEFSLGESRERASGSPLMEYRCIFFLIGLMYCRNDKLLKKFYLILLIITSALVFIGGNRANALSPIIVYYVYTSGINNKKRRFFKLLIVCIIGYVSMIAIGALRTSLFSSGGFDTVINKIFDEKLTFDTAIYAYFPGLSTISLSDSIDKWQSLLQHFFYIFVGGAYGQQRFQFIVRQTYFHTYGFVSPLYFYPWLGVLSGVGLSIIVNFYIKIIKQPSKKGISLYKYGAFLYFCAMTPRWYLYDPFPLIRGLFVYSIVFAVVYCGYNLITKKHINYISTEK